MEMTWDVSNYVLVSEVEAERACWQERVRSEGSAVVLKAKTLGRESLTPDEKGIHSLILQENLDPAKTKVRSELATLYKRREQAIRDAVEFAVGRCRGLSIPVGQVECLAAVCVLGKTSVAELLSALNDVDSTRVMACKQFGLSESRVRSWVTLSTEVQITNFRRRQTHEGEWTYLHVSPDTPAVFKASRALVDEATSIAAYASFSNHLEAVNASFKDASGAKQLRSAKLSIRHFDAKIAAIKTSMKTASYEKVSQPQAQVHCQPTTPLSLYSSSGVLQQQPTLPTELRTICDEADITKEKIEVLTNTIADIFRTEETFDFSNPTHAEIFEQLVLLANLSAKQISDLRADIEFLEPTCSVICVWLKAA